MNKFDFIQIANALQLTKRAVEMRANRENWPFTEESVRGGKRKLFAQADLPREIARRIEIWQRGTAAAQHNSIVRQLRDEAEQEQKKKRAIGEIGLRKLAELHAPGQASRYDARLTIVNHYEDWFFQRNKGALRPKDGSKPMGIKFSYVAYAAAFNSGEVDISAVILEKYQPLTARALEHWMNKYKKEGAAGLIDNWTGAARKDVNVFTTQPALQGIVRAILLDRPTITMKNLTVLLEKAQIDESTGEVLYTPPSYHAVVRFANAFKKKNAELIMATTNPDEWKNKYMVAFGNASEDVVRLNQRWEMDSTMADWMLIGDDGAIKRYNVSVIIDVYSRRSLMLVSPTPRTETHKLLLRMALLQWGVPEEVVTDNGKDYISREFSVTLNSLGITHTTTNPFSPWEKPFVERMNQTMLHSVLEAHSSFIGHSVAERSAIEARISFAERLFKKEKASIDLAMPAQLLRDRLNQWLIGTYEQRPHGELGMSPFQKAASWAGEIKRIEDERALDVLLAPPMGKGSYVITKKGLRIDNAQFLAMELSLMVGKTVDVRMTDDLGQIVVYHEGKFVCVARCPERTGISRQEIANKSRQVQRKNVTDQRKVIKGTKVNTDGLIDMVLRDNAEAAGKLATLPVKGHTYTTQMLNASGDAAKKLDGAAEKTQIPADLQMILNRQNSDKEQAPIQDEAASNITVIPETPQLRFKKWLELDQLLQQGELIDDATLTRWYRTYAQSNEHAGLMKRHEANASDTNEKRNTAATVLRLNNQTL